MGLPLQPDEQHYRERLELLIEALRQPQARLHDLESLQIQDERRPEVYETISERDQEVILRVRCAPPNCTKCGL